MAKRKNDFISPAEDYIEQLNWRAKHPGIRRGGRSSVWLEPKWKYKIVYHYPPTSPFEKLMRVMLPIGLLVGIYFLITSDLFTIELKIFALFMVVLIVTIIFFAVQDASKDSDNSKPLD
ncbi:MAG: hypothetical protein QM730_00750 [Anaerolineales bacterium]